MLVGNFVVPHKYDLEMGFNESRLQVFAGLLPHHQQTELIQKWRKIRICQENTSLGFISGTTEGGNQYLGGDILRDPWKMPPFDSGFLLLMPPCT